jgi:hypothetical protein
LDARDQFSIYQRLVYQPDYLSDSFSQATLQSVETINLFRDEVFEARKQRLYGEVVLTQPLSTKIMVAALFAIIIIAAVWVTQGTYSRIETVPGILVTNKATAKATDLPWLNSTDRERAVAMFWGKARYPSTTACG